uniref:DUF2059 domain-containing protein n=1 Tax=Candidatus Kentrum sp. TC TaxID=2126339 RepID=A0A450Y891_9GAMM|nr:MAG: hypothetical protein (DUF2059) [Candidatus Kentron sp. TC]VFK51419.1 MAG: hypothetical protein (DUF2059) [Candidatus Kentron sp. TC]
MKRIFLSCVILSIFLPSPTYADQASKEQLLRLVKAVGIYEQLEEQKTALQAHGSQAAKQTAQQIKASVPGLPEEFAKDSEYEFAVYMSNLQMILNTEHLVNTYIDLISVKLSFEEVSKLTEFYESDLGRKFTRSNIEVMGDWTKAFMSDFESTMTTSLESFTNNLMAKAARYRQAQ